MLPRNTPISNFHILVFMTYVILFSIKVSISLWNTVTRQLNKFSDCLDMLKYSFG